VKILYLEDDINLASTIEEFLCDEGFEVNLVYTSDEAIETLYSNNYDLLIFDVNVGGDMNGFELLKSLRDSNIQTPAIFTTSLNSIDDLSIGYDVGADDYIKKPFALKELLLRVKALLKREYKVQNDNIQIDTNIIFNTKTQEISVDEKIIHINQKESELLKLLSKNKNNCVTQEEIFESVWSYDEEHSSMSLRTYIKELRKIIGKDKIVTIKKKGYMLVD
jgi:DNA-binding response OmpR family regulator